MNVPLALWRLLITVPEANHGVHRDGADWKLRCPAHRDNVSSLAAKVGNDGRLLLYCHAGCSTADVLRAWGVEWSALFPDQPESNGARAAEPERTYDYQDEEGHLLFQVVRFPGKKFRQRRLTPSGDWAWNLQHTRRVLYGLPELLRRPQEPVYVVEGEKDADRLLEAGLLATTAPMGAGKWKRDYTEQLRGRDVVIIPDNDAPGLKHAEDVADQLRPVINSLKTLLLEEIPEHGDVSDWLEAGHTANELKEATNNLSLSTSPTSSTGGREVESQDWVLVNVGDLLSEEDNDPPDLVAGGLFPTGGLSIVGAKPKVGKSTLVRQLAVCIAQGTPFLSREVQQGTVLYLALEEKRREVREHFRQLGVGREDPLYVHIGPAPKDALGRLTVLLGKLKPSLVIIDTLFRFVKVRDVSAYAEITEALAPVLQIARTTGSHVLLVHHNTKVDREGADSVLGSIGIVGSVDTSIVMRRRSDGTRYAYSEQRYGKDLEPTVLSLTEDNHILAAASLEGYELEKAKETVLGFLEGQTTPLAEPAIIEQIELRKARCQAAIRALFNDGRISRWGTGRKGDPFLYGTPWRDGGNPGLGSDGNQGTEGSDGSDGR